jgi:hypothetical protein
MRKERLSKAKLKQIGAKKRFDVVTRELDTEKFLKDLEGASS